MRPSKVSSAPDSEVDTNPPSTGPPALLVVAPTRRELGGFRPGRHGPLLVGVAGLGEEAAPALAKLLALEHPAAVLSLGFAGALTAEGCTGDVVVCTEQVADAPSPPTAVTADPALVESARRGLDGSRLPHQEGKLLTTPSPLLTPEEKRRARLRSGALVVDMEGYWMARTAQDHETPFLALRVVLDPVDYLLPQLVATIVADQGRHEWRHTLRSVVARPWSAGRLAPLAYRSWRAQRSLRRLARVLAPQMQVPPP